MTSKHTNNTLDIAILPLADGRCVAIPLLALAEVQQFPGNDSGEDGLGTLHWRGHDLPIASLEEFCGLPAQPREQQVTVGVLRAGQDAEPRFRALAFCGLAAHRRVNASEFQALEPPQEGCFTAAAEVDGITCLIPDLPGLLYGETTGAAA